MKKILILIFSCLAAAVFYGHASTDAVFNYDLTEGNGVLTVFIEHSLKTSPVQDPAKHYIKNAVLYVKGKQVDKQAFSKQESIDGQTVIFRIILKAGDKISVKSACNMIGIKTVNYVVPEIKRKS